jgi:hypothetical protein
MTASGPGTRVLPAAPEPVAGPAQGREGVQDRFPRPQYPRKTVQCLPAYPWG